MTGSLTAPTGRRSLARNGWIVFSMLLLAGCGSTAPSGSASPGSVAPATVAPPAAGSPSSPVPSTSVPSGPTVDADPDLITIAASDRIRLTYDPETTASVAADPSLATSARALAIGLAVPAGVITPGASLAPGADLAVVSVIRLRDPSVGEAWFRGWRDSYDEAACANAGGVTRRAETEIAGRTVFIGSCAGGSFTYHARLENAPIVISLTSIGPGRLGATVMAGLTP